ncbi:MAG: hypothetical protein KGJ13_06105 [Patescibacteria group bacterium]|nr:hypothetical protein [Patescibacteria group bacterium]
MKTPYWLRLLIAFDMFCNVVFGGKFDETISARCGIHRAWYERACGDALNWLQPGHTEGAVHHDEERAIEALRDMERENE